MIEGRGITALRIFKDSSGWTPHYKPSIPVEKVFMSTSVTEQFHELAAQGREFYPRGWMYGTSGNLSVRLEESPLRIGVTASGVDKGSLSAEDIVTIERGAEPFPAHLRPSAETSIHEAVYTALEDVNAVLHVHTPASTVLSMRVNDGTTLGHLHLQGYEMLKGLGFWDEM